MIFKKNKLIRYVWFSYKKTIIKLITNKFSRYRASVVQILPNDKEILLTGKIKKYLEQNCIENYVFQKNPVQDDYHSIKKYKHFKNDIQILYATKENDFKMISRYIKPNAIIVLGNDFINKNNTLFQKNNVVVCETEKNNNALVKIITVINNMLDGNEIKNNIPLIKLYEYARQQHHKKELSLSLKNYLDLTLDYDQMPKYKLIPFHKRIVGKQYE